MAKKKNKANKTVLKTAPKIESKEAVVEEPIEQVSDTPIIEEPKDEKVVDQVSDTPAEEVVEDSIKEPEIEEPTEDPIVDPVGTLTEDPHTSDGVILTATQTVNYGDIVFIKDLDHNLSKKDFEDRKVLSGHFCLMLKKGIFKIK